MKLFFYFICIFSISISIAQTDDQPSLPVLTEEDPEEGLLYVAEEQAQQSTLIDLNRTNPIELFATGLLSQQQVNSILFHRQRYGKFLSVYELQSITSLSLDTILLLSHKVCVPIPPLGSYTLTEQLKQGNPMCLIRWTRKLNKSVGYIANNKGVTPYAGSDYQLLYRFRASYTNHYQLGITLEKDPGEPFQWNLNKDSPGFDFFSCYLLLYFHKVIRQLAIGDFHFRNGHGLIFGGNFFLSRNPEYWSSVWQLGNGFRPHSSSSEYGFFRGIGIRWQQGHWEGSSFYSITPQDGSLQRDGRISALNNSGLHRTQTEQEKRYNTRLSQWGGNFSYNSSDHKWQVGIEYLTSHFNLQWAPPATYYRPHPFQGHTHHIAGVVGQFRYASGIVFAEVAWSSGHGNAFYGGLVHNLSRSTLWMMQYWKTNASFLSFQGNIPSFSSSLSNETGIYQALLFPIHSKLRLSLGGSIYYLPMPSYQLKGPGYGNEWISRLTWQLKKKTVFYLQFRWKENESNFQPDSTKQTYIIPSKHSFFCIDLAHTENPIWKFHSRAQWTTLHFPIKEHGFCLTQSISLHFRVWKPTFQISIFKSDSWNSRLYHYEPDVPYAFSIPALSGEGIRLCLVHTFKLKEDELSIKFSHIQYTHQSSIGSGYDTVNANEQWEIKVQGKIML